ncbi:MAG: hypothetical protein PHY93_14210 [Bacteriovorax sp.]|nr:hypothetical protein [Bacteriovorax sp.]
MKNFNKFKKYIGMTIAIGISIFALFFVITCVWIGVSVKTKVQEAKADYGGSSTEALMTLLEDESQSFRSRNSTVWALGQLGDSQALPILEKYYTGEIPDREPLNEVISQYELKKAIKLLDGGKNLTAIFWRYGID